MRFKETRSVFDLLRHRQRNGLYDTIGFTYRYAELIKWAPFSRKFRKKSDTGIGLVRSQLHMSSMEENSCSDMDWFIVSCIWESIWSDFSILIPATRLESLWIATDANTLLEQHEGISGPSIWLFFSRCNCSLQLSLLWDRSRPWLLGVVVSSCFRIMEFCSAQFHHFLLCKLILTLLSTKQSLNLLARSKKHDSKIWSRAIFQSSWLVFCF